MKNEKFEEALKQYKEKQFERKDRYLTVSYFLAWTVGVLWSFISSILPIESTGFAVTIALLGAAVSAFIAFAVYYPVMCLLTDIKTNTWIVAHKDDYEEE